MKVAEAVDWLRGRVFEPHQEAAYLAHEREGNHSRLRLLLPLMLAAQILVTLDFAAWGDLRGALPADQLLLRDAYSALYGISAVGTGLLTLALFRGGPRLQEWLPTVAAMAYLLHTAGVVAIDQLHDPKLGVFGFGCFGVALLIAQSPGRIVATYVVGALALTVAVVGFQDDPVVLQSLLASGLTTVTFCCVLALFLVGARRRDFKKTLLIEEQAAQLADLNANLEQRVAEQVEALTRRAAEVEHLNAQLQDQVRDRSKALASALRRLAAGTSVVDGELEGRLIGDRFSIGRPLASGGMGSVYEGVDTNTGSSVAVKVIRSGRRTPVRLLERFLQEAEAVATVQHPAIVRMLHVDIDDDGTLFQVQELVRGQTLSEALDQRGAFVIGAAARVLQGLCEALAAAHAVGVVHRDVKPANIMLTRSAPGLKLLDFGISKLAITDVEEPTTTGAEATLFEGQVPADDPNEGSTDRQATRAGAVMGTPQFMSPEQRTDASRVTDRSDVYAVGVVAMLVYTGRLPVPGEPVDLGPGLDVVAAMLAEDPAARPTAEAAAAVFGALAAEEATPALEVLVAADGLARDTTDASETLLGGDG